MHNPSSFGPQPKCRLSLMGIRFANDPGDGTGAGGTPTPQPGENPAPKPGENDPTPKPGEGVTETPEQIIARLTADNERLEREKSDVRVAKEGALKAEAKRTELLALAKVLGVEGVKDDDTTEALTEKITGKKLADPVDSTDQITAVQTAAALQTATVTEAWKQGVPADKADYLAFKLGLSADYKNLDPKSDDFGAKLTAVVKATIDSDTAFKPSGGAGSSGGGDHGGSGGNQISKEQFDAMSVRDKTSLFTTDRAAFDRLVHA